MQLTLLDLLLQPVGPWWLRWGILLLAALGLLRQQLITHSALWLALAALTGLRVIADWPLSDNHAYLLAYWCLACGLAGFSDDPRAALARNARWMIGLAFLWASFWKLVLSGDYSSGVFFRVTMLMDPRLESFARIAGGLSAEQLGNLQDYINVHVDGAALMSADAPEEPRRFMLLAQLAAWWNIILNAAIAIAFLSPVGRGLSRYRDALLIVFCLVTYAIATVAGFGWLLIAMAVSQTDAANQKLRIVYTAVFAVILLYREIPWADAIILPVLERIQG